MTAITTSAAATNRNRKNRIFAILAAPAAIPVKPKNPATSEMRKKMSAHFNIFELLQRWACSGSSSHRAGDERNNKQHQEYEEQDFCDPRSSRRNAAKSEQGGHERDHEEQRSVVKHRSSPFSLTLPGVMPGLRVNAGLPATRVP